MNISFLRIADPASEFSADEIKLARVFESLVTGAIPLRPKAVFLAQAHTMLTNPSAVDVFFDTIEGLNR